MEKRNSNKLYLWHYNDARLYLLSNESKWRISFCARREKLNSLVIFQCEENTKGMSHGICENSWAKKLCNLEFNLLE